MKTARILNRLKDVAFVEPLVERWVRALRGRVTCLLYHRVDEPGAHPFLDRGGSPVIAPRALREELEYLLRLGARFHTFEDLRDGWFPEPDEIAVIASFDDGFRSNYTKGMDVLRSLAIPGVVFQTTGMLDGELLWEHALYWRTRDEEASSRFEDFARRAEPSLVAGPPTDSPTRRLLHRVSSVAVERLLSEADATLGETAAMSAAAAAVYPDAELIRRAHDEGHEIGAHGHRHYRRATIDAETFAADVERSRRVLADVLETPPRAFSYPFNSYLPGDDEIVSRHFDQAATVDKRRIDRDTDPLWLPRFTWPGPAPNALRLRRWLLTGSI